MIPIPPERSGRVQSDSLPVLFCLAVARDTAATEQTRPKTANNSISAMSDITIPLKAVTPASTTTGSNVTGNLPSDAAVGDQLVRDVSVYDANGQESKLTLTFTRAANGPGGETVWNVSGSNAGGAATTAGALSDRRPGAARRGSMPRRRRSSTSC